MGSGGHGGRGRGPGGRARAGAAGGVGYAALAVLGAALRPGIELVLELAGFAEKVTAADLVIIGEGSLDEQTLRGKARPASPPPRAPTASPSSPSPAG